MLAKKIANFEERLPSPQSELAAQTMKAPYVFDFIPFKEDMVDPRNKTEHYKVYKHVGIYAYRRDFLLQYAALAPTELEKTESLEQLRVLENGYKIKVLESDFQGIGVDTPEDLAAVNELLSK